jgi:glutathione peroxidase
MSVYDHSYISMEGKTVPLAEYSGKVLLIVNTASKCGFTPQYKGLQELYDKYRERGFEIFDFPCNQFGKQAPGSAEEIHQFCTLKYHTTFPQFAKINVNGKDEDPLYTFLKSEKSGILGSAIKWNFTKFLVDKGGTVVKRYGSDKTAQVIEKDIEELLV